jgi:hypothetical protein
VPQPVHVVDAVGARGHAVHQRHQFRRRPHLSAGRTTGSSPPYAIRFRSSNADETAAPAAWEMHLGSALSILPDVVLEKPHHRGSQGTSSFLGEPSTGIKPG